MKCPDCKGDGWQYEETGVCHPVTGFAEVIKSICETCGGTGEMNEIVICSNIDCEYYREDYTDNIDKTNCTVHDSKELLNGDCKEYRPEK